LCAKSLELGEKKPDLTTSPCHLPFQGRLWCRLRGFSEGGYSVFWNETPLCAETEKGPLEKGAPPEGRWGFLLVCEEP